MGGQTELPILSNFYVTVSASLLQLARDYFILPVVPSQTLHTSFSIFFQKVTLDIWPPISSDPPNL